MSSELAHLATQFFAAARALAWHTGSLQERLADAYADHLLSLTGDALPPELQPAFRELEGRLTQAPADTAVDDPFQAATRAMSDAEARALIERILLLYGRLAGAATA